MNTKPNKSIVTIEGRTYTHRTNDGKMARIVCVNCGMEGHPVLALIKGYHDTTEVAFAFTPELTLMHSEKWLIEGAEPEVEWEFVEVDTPIWVRDQEGHDWLPRHFAHISNGRVYAFSNNGTSHTSPDDATGWRHAVLAKPKRVNKP